MLTPPPYRQTTLQVELEKKDNNRNHCCGEDASFFLILAEARPEPFSIYAMPVHRAHVKIQLLAIASSRLITHQSPASNRQTDHHSARSDRVGVAYKPSRSLRLMLACTTKVDE